MKNNEKKTEENLLEIMKIEEEKDNQLLELEHVIAFMTMIAFLTLTFVCAFGDMESWLRILIIVFSIFILGFCVGYGIRIEKIAGYYKCPKCAKYSWNKKVLNNK